MYVYYITSYLYVHTSCRASVLSTQCHVFGEEGFVCMPTSGLKLVGLNSLYNAFNVYIHVHVDMLASYSGKAHNYQKLAACTACTLTSIPRTNMCMKI